jgi:hypothetical protein
MGLFRFLGAAAYWAQDQFDWLLKNIVFPLQIVFMLMASWGLVGSELGIERLFWSEDWLVQLSSGFAVGMLFGIILYIWYLLEQPTRFVNLVAPVPEPGQPSRYLSLLPSATSPEVRRVGAYLLWAMMLLLLAMLIGKVIVVACQAASADPPLNIREYYAGRLYLAFGSLGFILSLALAWILYKIDEVFKIRDRISNWGYFRRRVGFPERVSAEALPLHAVMAYLLGVSLILLVIAAVSVKMINERHPGEVFTGPVSLVSLILILFNQLYGLWSSQFRLGTVLLIVVGGSLAIWNSSSVFPEADYKLRFPGLEAEYDPARRVNLTDLNIDTGWIKNRPEELPAPYKKLLRDEDVLSAIKKRWAASPGHEQTQPKIILIAVSGGGIRSAVWTTAILEVLEKEMPGIPGKAAFRNHVRMFTGASGGMVGAALYVADFEHDWPDRGNPAATGADTELGFGVLSGTVAEQSLLPTFQTAFLRDFSINVFVPPWHTVRNDRGRALEQKWALNARARGYGPGGTTATELANLRAAGKRISPFSRTFADLYPLEQQGLRPSLVFSPMFVEDSRRLLVSNLDLGELAIAKGPVARTPEEGSIRVDGQYSRSGLELFKLFPSAHLSFEVGTAGRMSATFPIISPAVSLPTVPPRRVVDAGYFDNYGVDLAAMWLIQNRLLLRDYVGGIALVELRAFPLQDRGLAFRPNDPEYAEVGGVLGDAVATFSTPLNAVLRARANASYHRNNELLAALDYAFNTTAPKDSPLFRRFVFELNSDASLNWYLSNEEKRGISQWAQTDAIKKQAMALAEWLGDGGGPPW